jgi:hypothetical protein
MATETIPTTIAPDALDLAREYGVERELDGILEHGRTTITGLRALRVEVLSNAEMWPDDLICVEAEVDQGARDHPTHRAWWEWRLDRFPLETALRFLLTFSEVDNGR